MKNIVLIGMPGAGKSTIGVVLAKIAGINFVDTDLLIQQQEGKLLQVIVDEIGCDNFIVLEGDFLSAFKTQRVSVVATGGSAVAAIDFVKQRGGKNIVFMCLIAAPEGIEVLQKAHPDVDIYIAAKDECLNENAYIVPGLGDAGDRIFGTK